MSSRDPLPVIQGPRKMNSNSPSYHTYVQYLSSILPQFPEYTGLHEFLDEALPSSPVGTRALIIDTSVDNLSVRSFENATTFRGALALRLPETTNRLVFVHYMQTKTVNGAFIDAIGLRFDINPLFFCNHFFSGLEVDVRAKWEVDGISNYAQLSSQNISLEIGHLAYLHASILFLGGTGQSHDEQPTSKFLWITMLFLVKSLISRSSFSTYQGQRRHMQFSCARTRETQHSQPRSVGATSRGSWHFHRPVPRYH